MQQEPDVTLESSSEQNRYAAFLGKGMFVGLVCLFVTFALYVFGVMEPHVPLQKLPDYWTKNVHEYLELAQLEAGWSWVRMLNRADVINFVGIVILAGVTVLCYLSILPLLLKRRDFVYAVLALLEVIVLLFAASGIIAVGH